MKRHAILTIAVIFLTSSSALSSCTWKKASDSSPESKTGQSDGGSAQVDYASGATVVDESSSGSGELEKVSVSSGSVLGLGAAINSGKTQGCDKLTTPADVQACKDEIYFKSGTEDHDYALCEKITRPRNRQICSSRVSRYLLDFGSCEKIQDEAIKKNCLEKGAVTETKMAEQTAAAYKKTQASLTQASTAGTAKARVEAACGSLNGVNRNFCYSTKVSEEIAKGETVALCAVIPDAATKSACEQKASAQGNKAILDRAVAAKDPSMCDALALAQDKDLCKKIVAG